MSSPIPPDPYEALGVPKDAEVSVIRTAYRKLVLIHHPDRIKDEALREKGKDAFQKIQQAYEILSDPLKKKRHDDRVLLAQLRKEKMMRDPPPRAAPSTYTTRPSTAPTPAAQPQPATREYRQDGNFFEEVRQPRNVPSYEEPYVYEDPLRTTSRKHPEYEKRSPVPKATEKKSKTASAFAAASIAASFTSKLRSQAAEKKSDREKRRDRSEKVQTRKSAYVDEASSESEYEEIRPSVRPSPRSKPASDYPRTTPSRPEKTRDAEDDSGDGKWEKHHDNVKAYLKAANRPGLERTGSDAYQYWASAEAKGRKSGSDNEKRPDSSKGRRVQDDYFSSTTPTFTKATSSPSNLRAHVEERAPPRSSVGATRDRDHRERDRDYDRDHRERETTRGRDRIPERERERSREHRNVPSLSRSHTTPATRPTSRKDSSKGSNLRHENTPVHDSGYGSSSSPHTPEMKEHSPPRNSKGRYPPTTSTKYHIVDPPEADDEEAGRAPRVTKIQADDDRHQRYLSPERDTYTREPERRARDKQDRPRTETTSRSKSSRGASMMQEIAPEKPPPPVRRSESQRYEERSAPRSSHEAPHISRHDSGREKLFREVGDSSPDDRYSRPYPEKVNVAPRRDTSTAKYASYARDTTGIQDAENNFRFSEGHRTTRRPSVYT